MRLLVLLWGCLVLPGYEALKGPKEISGFEGDTVSLQCTYAKKLAGHTKYWCRQGGILVSRCGDIVYTNQDQEVTRGIMSIRDSPQELLMTVTMRDLTLKDSGKYWCGIDRLGRDESFEVTLTVFPASPGLHPTVVTAKQGKTGVKAPVFTEVAPAWSTGTSQVPPGISPHTATSPHAGGSRPVIWLPLTTPKDSSAIASSVSKSSVSIPTVRMMAPVLVLLSLLLATGLIAFGRYMLLWRKKAWLATETQKKEKVYLETSPPGNSWTPEDSTIDLAVLSECLRTPHPSAVPSPETQNLSQSTEEEAVPSLDAAKKDVMAAPPLQTSAEELAFSEFISV